MAERNYLSRYATLSQNGATVARRVTMDGYIRVSRVGGREGDSFISPDLQREQIERWAKLRNVEIAAWHVDLDESGGKRDRPGMDAMLERVRSGATQGVAVARIDRLSRLGVADALKLVEEIIEHGGQLAAIDLGIDPATPFGEFALTIMLGLARMERRRITDSWAAAQEHAVARGIHIASAAPTGYDRGEDKRLVPNEHAPGVTEAFRMKAAGASLGDIGRFLEARKVVGPYGGERWVRKAVSGVLANRVYLGEARSGIFSKQGAHPALIDAATFEAVQRPRQEIVRGEGALLSSIIRCAGCGFVMKADTMRDRSGAKLAMYRCRGEHGMGRCEARASVLARIVEPVVLAWFDAHLGDVEVRGAAVSRERVAVEERLRAVENEVEAYRDQELASVLGRERYVAGLRTRINKADAVRAELAALAPVAEMPSRALVSEVLEHGTMRERRRLLQAGLDVVFIRSGRSLPIGERVAVFARGDWPATLPGKGRFMNAPRSVLWDRFPDGARVPLSHDLRQRRGD